MNVTMLCMVTLLVLLEIPSVLCNPPSKFLSSAFASKQSETVSSSSSHSRASSSSSSNPDDEMLSEVFISLPVPAVSSSSASIDIMGGESSTKVKHIANSKEFNDILSDEAGKLLVVDFSAAWCMPCKMIAPVFEEMAGEFESSCTFLKVDVDDTPEIAEKYQVASMPTFLFIKNGELKDRFSGASVEKLRETIQKLL